MTDALAKALEPFSTYTPDWVFESKARFALTETTEAGGGWFGAEDFRAARTALAAYRSEPAVEPESRAIADIAAERRRQIEEEGWTPEHDDQHTGGQLAYAAACYAISSSGGWLPWPWDTSWWKPSHDRRDLVKAGALIAAEIDRLDRLASAAEDR